MAFRGASDMGQGEDIVVQLPRPLQDYSEGRDAVMLAGATLQEVLGNLNRRFPGLGHRILDDQGRVRRYIHVFVNDEAVGHRPPEKIALESGDTVHILPSVAGG